MLQLFSKILEILVEILTFLQEKRIGCILGILGAVIITCTAVYLVSLFPFIALSIICTGGTSLIIWTPLAWGFGLLLSKIIFGLLKLLIVSLKNLIGEEIPEIKIQKPVLVKKSKEQQAIINYIDRAIKSKCSYEGIIFGLKAKGWRENEIKRAFDIYKGVGY